MLYNTGEIIDYAALKVTVHTLLDCSGTKIPEQEGDVSTVRGPGIARHLTSTVKSSDVTNVRSCLISKTLGQTRDKVSDKLQITANFCYHEILFVFGQ